MKSYCHSTGLSSPFRMSGPQVCSGLHWVTSGCSGSSPLVASLPAYQSVLYCTLEKINGCVYLPVYRQFIFFSFAVCLMLFFTDPDQHVCVCVCVFVWPLCSLRKSLIFMVNTRHHKLVGFLSLSAGPPPPTIWAPQHLSFCMLELRDRLFNS